MELLQNYKIAVPDFKVATSPEEAHQIATEFGLFGSFEPILSFQLLD